MNDATNTTKTVTATRAARELYEGLDLEVAGAWNRIDAVEDLTPRLVRVTSQGVSWDIPAGETVRVRWAV